MDVIDNFAESIGTKQTRDYERQTEEFEVVKVGIVNNKFNFTLQNTGNIPVKITRLWVKNTTDSTWPFSKFNINAVIAPGATVTNVSQNIGLISLNTQSYYMKLVTERGNSQKLFLNSVGGESLYLKLHATPTTVATGFTTTLTLEVINTGTNQLLNLQAQMNSVISSCGSTCSFNLVSGPSPTTFSSLDPGDIAIFEWIYSLTGENADQFTFTASLVNGIDLTSTTASVKAVQFAENSEVALTSAGLLIPSIDDSILLFHQETFDIPASTPPNVTYQMYSATSDGGVDGTLVQLDTVLLSSLFTKNGTDTVTIPAGKWNASLYLQSEAMTTSLISGGEDIIFHFEDGAGGNPDNSERSSANRDLENCGGISFQVSLDGNENDNEETNPGGVRNWSSSDLELMSSQIVGVRFNGVNIPKNTPITSAFIQFMADESDSATSPTYTIWGHDINNAGPFVDANNDLINRAKTSASVTWSNVPAWTAGDQLPAQKTPDLKDIVQEIVNRGGWAADNMAFLIEATGSNRRVAEAQHGSSGGVDDATILTITHSEAGGADGEAPTWDATGGPHGSGSYQFDGANDCFRSLNDVRGPDGNDVETEPDTTSLWFQTAGTVTTEQYLVYWDSSSSSHYYKISLLNGNVRFQFNTGSGSTNTCDSTSTYDDTNWYHVTAVREGPSADECNLYIHNLSGTLLESINDNQSFTDNNVDADGRWLVASDKSGNGNFNGHIDDVIHWNDKALTAAEATDLARTNYGTGAHQLDVKLDITDSDGNLVSNVFDGPQTPIAFQDSKNLGDNNDAGYGIFNITMNLPQVIVTSGQRLNFSMNFVPSTATWIPLELDMKIDDDTLSPFPSYLQMPKPDKAFPSYFTYDNDFEADIFITNSGNDGIYFIHTGTRLNFNGTNGAYAGLIHSVNGSAPAFAVDNTRDSIYIPVGAKAELFFYIPTDQPSTTALGTTIPPGIYRTAIWLHGYTDQGETFQRSIVLGSVNVIE